MIKYTLLIIEDNFSLSTSLRSQLKKQYQVTQAPTLHAAMALCTEQYYDLILLDRSLPDGDGTELLSFLTKNAPQTKICVMSNRADLLDRLQGLNLGADHYLAKPFHPQEVSTLLRVLLRRGNTTSSNILQKNDLELHLGKNALIRNTLSVKLTPRESQLLRLFLNSTSCFISLEQIHNWLWKNGREVSNSYIHVSIQRLRKKLKVIHCTIVGHYGTGYELRILE